MAAYNNGYIHGAWVDVTDDRDEIERAIHRILHTTPCLPRPSESWAVHDLEGFEGYPLGEHPSLDDLVALDDELARRGISLVFAEMKGPIKDRLIQFGVSSRFGPDHFFPTVTNAVRSYKRLFGLDQQD